MMAPIGPSDALLQRSDHALPAGDRRNVSVGLAWATGPVSSLADLEPRAVKATTEILHEAADCVRFRVVYSLAAGPGTVVETYTLRADEVRIDYEAPGWTGPLAIRWPVFAGDGASEAEIEGSGASVAIAFRGDRVRHQCFGTDAAVVPRDLSASQRLLPRGRGGAEAWRTARARRPPGGLALLGTAALRHEARMHPLAGARAERGGDVAA
jgi:hypothetical protein